MNRAMTAPSTCAWLTVRGLAKRYGQTPVFAALDLALDDGQTLVVIGASGCGKTTLLRILAGLERADSGSVHILGHDVSAATPQARGAVYLYQEALLFPHLDVFENIAFGLRLRALPQATVNREVEAMLVALELEGFARRRPESLSGGQRQRVAFGRALAVKPALLLLDEPFSNLDGQARASMQLLCKRLTRQHSSSVVFVTHDLKEALIMGERFGRLADGCYQSYADRAAFCADPASGVQAELAFWRDSAAGLAVFGDSALSCAPTGPHAPA